MIKGLTPQRIIQEKTYALRLQFSQEDVAKINHIWFSCAALDIVKEMTLRDNVYTFELSWQETKDLKPMNTTYNITIQLVGEEQVRDLANGVILQVVKNQNPVGDGEEEELNE